MLRSLPLSLSNFTPLVPQLAVIFDLRDKEALVMVTLLRLGSQPAHIMGTHLGLKRTTIYSILENLVKRQLVKKHPIGSSTLFSVASLPELQQLLSQKQQSFTQKKSALKELLPSIQEIMLPPDTNPSPHITHYEGVEIVQTELHKLWAGVPCGSTIIGYVHAGKRGLPEWPQFWPQCYKLRQGRRLFMKQISPDTATNREYATQDHAEYRESRLIPRALFPFADNYEIDIMPKAFVTLYLHPIQPWLTIYHDEKMAAAQTIIFNHYWQLAANIRRNSDVRK